MSVYGGKFQELIQEEFRTYKSKNRRYSLRSFAKFLEIAPTTLHQYLSGMHEPNRKNFLRLATKLKWSKETVNEFLDAHRSSHRLPVVYLESSEALSEELIKLMSLSSEQKVTANIDELMQRLALPAPRRQSLEEARDFLIREGHLFVTDDVLEFTAVLRKKSSLHDFHLPLHKQVEAVSRLSQAVANARYASLIVSTIQLDPGSVKVVEQEFARFLQKVREKHSSQSAEKNFEVLLAMTPTQDAAEMP